MSTSELIYVGIDVGCHTHRVAISGPQGALLDELDIPRHSALGFETFFARVAAQEGRLRRSV